ncbi:MAG TPA: aquaporin [Solirubrobacteraceae bacterium]|nr:aquaporin [Solirubrobacteraceae bacterium]
MRPAENFGDPRQEGRRLFGELLGTFMLVAVAAGAPMMGHAFPGSVSRDAAVVAPGLAVLAVILSTGRVSGAHLNPVVSIAFALRQEFPWRRVPGYVAMQLAGALLAALAVRGIVGVSSSLGSTYPAPHHGQMSAFWLETLLTFGLVGVILGTASGAQNVGPIGALAVGGYIALAGLWASPLSGASMNPVRTLAPDLVGGRLTAWWVYLAGPLVGALLAVAAAVALRGRGGDRAAALVAQGAPAAGFGGTDRAGAPPPQPPGPGGKAA